MSSQPRHRRLLSSIMPGVSWRSGLCLFLMSMTACSSQDCSCSGFETRPFPAQHYDKTVQKSAQVRVTGEGLDFVEQNIEPLVQGALPDGLSFCLPKDTSSDTKLCFPYVRDRSGFHMRDQQPVCANNTEGCQIDLVIEKTEIEPKPPNGLDVRLDIGGLNATIPFETRAPLIGTRITCDVTPYARGGDIDDPAVIGAIVPVRFNVDTMSPTGDMRIDLEEIGINLDELDFDLNGGALCSTADFLRGLFRGTLEDQIRDQLRDTVDATVRENLCVSCATESCPGNATCSSDGICEYATGECVPVPLGAEGRLLLSETIGDFVETPDANVDALFKVADYANVDTGLTLGLRTGFQPEKLSDCIPIDPTTRPAFTPVPISPTIVGDVRPGNNQPFHVGIAVHKGTIEHMLWGAWASGATCLKVDSATTAQLSTAALGIFVRSLNDLTDGDNRQAELKIVPQTAPRIVLGANRVVETADGYEVEEGLFTIDWKDLDLHIYGWLQARWTRVATVRLDLLLPIAVVPDGAGGVSVALGDVEQALTNLRGLNGELLKEDPEDLAEVIPSLVGLALPALADSLDLAFELPEFFGLRIVLEQGDITSVDGGQFIALLANLETSGNMPNSFKILPKPSIDSAAVIYPERAALDGRFKRPVVRLDLSASLPGAPRALVAGEDVEFAWRVDGGFWSLYNKLDAIEIQDPLLALPGEHTIEVRARVARNSQLVNHTDIARTTVLVDYQPPTLELERASNAATLSFKGRDLTDSPSDLRYRYKIHDGQQAHAWSAWSTSSELDLDALGLADRDVRVEVEVRDRQGFTARDVQTVRALTPVADQEPTTSEDASSASSCSTASTGAGAPSSPLTLILCLGALFGLTRRRKKVSAIARGAFTATLGLFSTAAISGCGGCDDGTASTNQQDNADPLACATPCAADEVCKQSICVKKDPDPCQTTADCSNQQQCEAGLCVEPECREDADCGAVCGASQRGTCADNACVCEDYCPDGCGETQFCCFASNACQDYPDPCDGKVCEPGFMPGNPMQGSVDANSCMVTGSSCECVPAPPLPIGDHGRYSSLTRSQGDLFIATYNETYGDLMVGLVDDTNNTVRWDFVDGVPADGDVEGALDGPRGGIKDKGAKVGAHTAMVSDLQGNLHVFYQDVREESLLYARGQRTASGTIEWAISPIAHAGGDAGLYSEAQLSADGKVHLITLVDNVPADGGPRTSELLHLAIDPGAPADGLTLDDATVIAFGPASEPCSTSCADGEVCIRESGACVVPDDAQCAAGCSAGFACDAGSCKATYDKSLAIGSPRMLGAFPDLTVTPDGGLLVTFYDGLDQRVAWSILEDPSSSAWSMPQFLDVGTGPYSSAVVGAEGTTHIVYMHDASKSLRYESFDSGGVGSNPEIVTRGLRDTGSEWLLARIGEDVQLQLDASSQPEVIFHDATLHRLMHARRQASGAWMSTTLSQKTEPFDGSHGFYAELLRLGPDSVAVEYVINKQVSPVEAYPAFHALP